MTQDPARQRSPRRSWRGWIVPVCVALAAIASVAAIAAPRRESGSPAPAASAGPACGQLTVSPPTTVLDAEERRRLDLTSWPDTQLGVLRSATSSYRFVSAGAASGRVGAQGQTVTSGTLDRPAAGGVAARSFIEALPAGFSYAGAGQLWRDPRTGTVLQVVHLERQFAPGRPLSFWTEIGLARLDETSLRATFLGTILRPAVTVEQAASAGATVDLGTPSLVARNGYLYIYFSDFARIRASIVSTSLSVARTPLTAAVVAAQNGRVTTWTKYRAGAWLDAGGGMADDVAPGSAVMWEPSAAYDPAQSRFIVVAPVSRSRVVLAASTEPNTRWSRQQVLWEEPGKFDAYPVIVGTDGDPAAPGATFYVYYLQWPSAGTRNWRLAVLLRRTVTCLRV